MNGLDEKLGNHDDDYHFEAEASSFFLSFVNLSFRSSSNALTKRNYQKVCLSTIPSRAHFSIQIFFFYFPNFFFFVLYSIFIPVTAINLSTKLSGMLLLFIFNFFKIRINFPANKKTNSRKEQQEKKTPWTCAVTNFRLVDLRHGHLPITITKNVYTIDTSTRRPYKKRCLFYFSRDSRLVNPKPSFRN
jgi:hypothetical protein